MTPCSSIARLTLLCLVLILSSINECFSQKKAVFIILDGISADILEEQKTPVLDEIAKAGGYTRAWLGGMKAGYSQSPTVSAVGYNHILTGTWSNKHNVWDNDIAEPNYHYHNIFRIAKTKKPNIKTAIFSSWQDNRTKLVGEGLSGAGNIKLNYSFDGFEHDKQKFPHTEDRKFMFDIDEHVSKEAGRYIAEYGPDLSWVYLEFTDDMGHMFGDSQQYFDAIRKADAQVGRIWEAIQKRQLQHNEEWMIVVTTDHGRDAETGKHHGGQSDRERTVWITTNVKSLNERFKNNPASVDIMPSILHFMGIEVPFDIKREVDGVPFIGKVSVANLEASKKDKQIDLQWQVLNPEGEAEIFITATNQFKNGKKDEYKAVGKVKVRDGRFRFTAPTSSEFYKVVLQAPHNMINTWIVTTQVN